MNSNLLFARFNLQLKNLPNKDDVIASLQELLFDTATWAGDDDPEVFYESDKNIIGVSISLENDVMFILEAGAILGQCQAAFEKSGYSDFVIANWLSIADANGKVIESPY